MEKLKKLTLVFVGLLISVSASADLHSIGDELIVKASDLSCVKTVCNQYCEGNFTPIHLSTTSPELMPFSYNDNRIDYSYTNHTCKDLIKDSADSTGLIRLTVTGKFLEFEDEGTYVHYTFTSLKSKAQILGSELK